jgi:hypothetical protein
MTTINTVLGFVSIAGALLVGVTLLAFVVALWINQPQINKQQLAGQKVCRSGLHCGSRTSKWMGA